MTKSLHMQALQKSWEGTPEEMRLQATAENWQRWCGRDMAWEIVPGIYTSGGDRAPTVHSRVRRTDSDDVNADGFWSPGAAEGSKN